MRLPLTLERKLTLILVTFFVAMLLVVILLLGSLRMEYDSRVYSINSENTRSMLSGADAAFSETMLLGELFVADDFFQENLAAIKDSPDSVLREEIEGDIVTRLSNMFDTSEFMDD